jgi:hypothetical protein
LQSKKAYVAPASRKDMASADKHQGSCSSKPVGADSLDDEEEESFLNWISWCTSDQLSRVVRKMDDCLVLHVNLPTAITHWCDSIQCLAGAPALEVACDHSYVKMCLHIIFQKFHGCCNMVEHGFGAHTVALSIELMP